MDLTPINHKTYPRAVTASSEGHLRSESTAPKSSYAQRHEQAPTLAQKRESHPAEVARQYQEQRADLSASRQRGGKHGNNRLEEQLAEASRRSRSTHVRRRYSPPALISSRGHEANRRYLDTSMTGQPRIIDEVV